MSINTSVPGAHSIKMIANFNETATIRNSKGGIVSQYSVQWNSSITIKRSSPDAKFSCKEGLIGQGQIRSLVKPTRLCYCQRNNKGESKSPPTDPTMKPAKKRSRFKYLSVGVEYTNPLSNPIGALKWLTGNLFDGSVDLALGLLDSNAKVPFGPQTVIARGRIQLNLFLI